jgi:hypothetical protein
MLSPLTLHVTISPDSRVTCLVTLDVCHASSSPASVNADMPLFCEGLVDLVLLEAVASHPIYSQLSAPLLIPCPEERPPKA